MKKIAFILALVMVFAVALVACDETPAESSNPATESTPAESTPVDDESTPAESTPVDDESTPAESEPEEESQAPAAEVGSRIGLDPACWGKLLEGVIQRSHTADL